MEARRSSVKSLPLFYREAETTKINGGEIELYHHNSFAITIHNSGNSCKNLNLNLDEDHEALNQQPART